MRLCEGNSPRPGVGGDILKEHLQATRQQWRQALWSERTGVGCGYTERKRRSGAKMRHDESTVQKNASLNCTHTRLMGREEHGVQEI